MRGARSRGGVYTVPASQGSVKRPARAAGWSGGMAEVSPRPTPESMPAYGISRTIAQVGETRLFTCAQEDYGRVYGRMNEADQQGITGSSRCANTIDEESSFSIRGRCLARAREGIDRERGNIPD